MGQKRARAAQVGEKATGRASGQVKVCRDCAELRQAFWELQKYNDADSLRVALPGLLARIVHGTVRVARCPKNCADREWFFQQLLEHRPARFHPPPVRPTGRAAPPSPQPSAVRQLTPREREIAAWVVAGKTNREIAIILNAKVRTIEKHMERILNKFGAENRTSVARMAAQAIRPE